jgi:hypothetical protein
MELQRLTSAYRQSGIVSLTVQSSSDNITKEKAMDRKTLLIAGAIAGALISSACLAHGDWNGQEEHHHRGYYASPYAAPYVIVQPAYVAPAPVVYYEAPPRVIYQERQVVYQARPAYYPPAPVVSGRPGVGTGQVIGALTGAAVGSTMGRGNGRTAAIAVGAVLGSAIGGNACRDGNCWD